ncbi:MAG: GTP-binding protein [Synergistaceae bacterium]|nr:GTP-binding protein [Synergistaceae bacterium]
MGSRQPENTRSFALVAHGGAGKTTLAEAMLFTNGQISRMGKTESGNTVSDFSSEEQKRQISISTSLLTLERAGKTLFMLDAPGFADFTAEMSAAIRVADTALLVLSAVGGVEVQTGRAWEYATENDAPVAFYISKMDRENANFDKVLADIKEQFSGNAFPVFLPIGGEASFRGVVDVLKGRAYTGAPDGSGKFTEGDIPADLADAAAAAREALVEAAVEMDDALMERYLDGEAVGDERRRAPASGLHRRLLPLPPGPRPGEGRARVREGRNRSGGGGARPGRALLGALLQGDGRSLRRQALVHPRLLGDALLRRQQHL